MIAVDLGLPHTMKRDALPARARSSDASRPFVADGPLVGIARRHRLRTALRVRILLVYRCAYEDAAGRLVHSRLVAVTMALRGHGPDLGRAHWTDPAVLARIDEDCRDWRETAQRVTREFTLARRLRERAIAANAQRHTAIVSTRSFRPACSPCARGSRAACGRSCRAARRQTGGRGGRRHADPSCAGTTARPDPPRCCPGVTAISCRRLFSNASQRSSPRPHGWINDGDALPSGAARRGCWVPPRRRRPCSRHQPSRWWNFSAFAPPERIELLDSAVAATVTSAATPVAIIVTSWAEPLDPLWRLAVTQALQRCAVWCVLFDGLRLRLIDVSRLYARRYLEFDLDLVLDHPIAFAAFWRVFSAAALTAGPGDPSSLHALVAASDRHAAGVCRSLRTACSTHPPTSCARCSTAGDDEEAQEAAQAAFEQALTIVYRMLFLLFAEARSLVPLWHPVYRDSYSLEALRDLADDSRRRPGVWEALRAIARLAHAGCRAGDLRVTPFNGRLFSPARTPLAERRDLDDESARQAVRALSSRPTPDRAGRERIAYRDLGVEQLGAVYETLLDYEPTGNGDAVRLESGSGIRKATGTFYTPQPIADYLVRRTLAPLVRDAAPERILELRVVDPAMGSGAFLVAACRYLAAAYESALVRSGGCHAADLGPSERSAIRRAIAERCLYGVDRNPMAVQLGRLSLWLATLAADRPLSFLDHRLQVGDSLLGAWVASLRHAPAKARRVELPLFDDDEVAGALRDALPVRFSLESTPNNTLDQVRAKERAFASLTDRDTRLSRWKRVADLWCAAWFRTGDTPPPAAFGALSDAVLKGRGSLPAALADRFLATVDDVAAARRFFHWELEFPEVFFDRDGARLPAAGFDAVIGNPPWDMVRADNGKRGHSRERQTRCRVSAPVHARCRRLPGAVGRSCEPVSALPRARDRAHSPRRTHRPRAAVRPRHRSRQRAAAPAAPVPLRPRCAGRHRQPPWHLSHPSQRRFPAGHGIAGLADAARRLSLRD